MELRRGGREAAPRALHVLVWLGSGAREFLPFRPLPKAASAAAGADAAGGGEVGTAGAPLLQQQLLAARRGLQDWIGHVLSAVQDWGTGTGTGESATIDSRGDAAGAEALERSGLGALVAAAALLEELLPAAAPGLVAGGAAAGTRNASRTYTQARTPGLPGSSALCPGQPLQCSLS